MTSSSQDLMRDLHWTLEMDSNQSGAVGGTRAAGLGRLSAGANMAFRQARNYNFRDKCVVFARNLKFSNLT